MKKKLRTRLSLMPKALLHKALTPAATPITSLRDKEEDKEELKGKGLKLSKRSRPIRIRDVPEEPQGSTYERLQALKDKVDLLVGMAYKKLALRAENTVRVLADQVKSR